MKHCRNFTLFVLLMFAACDEAETPIATDKAIYAQRIGGVEAIYGDDGYINVYDATYAKSPPHRRGGRLANAGAYLRIHLQTPHLVDWKIFRNVETKGFEIGPCNCQRNQHYRLWKHTDLAEARKSYLPSEAFDVIKTMKIGSWGLTVNWKDQGTDDQFYQDLNKLIAAIPETPIRIDPIQIDMCKLDLRAARQRVSTNLTEDMIPAGTHYLRFTDESGYRTSDGILEKTIWDDEAKWIVAYPDKRAAADEDRMRVVSSGDGNRDLWNHNCKHR